MKKFNRILSFLLALVMVFTIAPATVFAQSGTDALEGWSITLGDDIGVKFYLDSADYTVAATVNGEAVIPTISDNVATVNVAAAQMNDPIVLTVKDADQVVHTGQYSVRQYADTILNGSYDEKAKDMVKQMLNYGAASQTYFNYNTKNLANSGITVSETTMPAENPQVSITDNLDGINFYGASLVMRNKTAVRFYFRVTGDVGSFTFSQGTPVLKDDLYYVEIDGINPQDYAEDIALSVNDGALSVTYSPLTYLARKYNNAESSNEMKALVQAMYGYHLEAIEYQAYLESTHADDHIWLDATCIEPKTCSVCGAIEGDRLAHTDVNKDHACDACVSSMVIWHMNDVQDAADWTGYHAKQENEALTTTVTDAGMTVAYQTPGNGWKGIVLEKTLIDISKLTGKLTGKLTFTYSSDMAITSYRIHILTNLGGSLTTNGTEDCYTAVSVADIIAGNLKAWTQTTNADGSVTVTFNLSSMGYFAGGEELRGLTIVTVTANNTPGTVTYNSVEMETFPEGYNCRTSGHTWTDATCTETKICSVCGATDGEVQTIHPANVRVLTLNVAYYDGAYTNDHLADDVTLLSNMSYTNQDMEEDYSFAERADRLLSLLEYYDPGVFFLNEFNFAWWQEVISDEDAILKALPEYTYVDSRSTGSSRNGEGEKYKDLYNMVFYDQEQFTLLDTGSFVTCEPWSGWYDHCTWAKLEHKESGQAAVYATIHVQTVPSGEQQIERAILSLQAAATAVEELYKVAEDLPIILGGDFNTTETSRGYRTYEYMVNQAGYKDSRYAAPQTDSSGTARIWGSSLKNNGNRIDYIFVNGASVKKYQVASGSFLKDNTYVEEVTEADLTPDQECSYYDISDHLPVVSDIILKSSRSIAPEEYVDPAGESDVAAASSGSYTENGGTANN